LALYPQLAGRVVGGDLEALFAAARHRADLLVDGPHADGPSETLGDLAGLDDGVVPLRGRFRALRRQAWGAASQSCGPLSLPPDSAAQPGGGGATNSTSSGRADALPGVALPARCGSGRGSRQGWTPWPLPAVPWGGKLCASASRHKARQAKLAEETVRWPGSSVRPGGGDADPDPGPWALGAGASTVGTFLRAFTFSHVRQLDQLTEHALTRAWVAGAGPGDAGAHRRGLHHHRGPRPRQAGRQLRLHPPAGLPPAAGHPCGHRRGAARPPACWARTPPVAWSASSTATASAASSPATATPGR
jgi:hypothetical protein